MLPTTCRDITSLLTGCFTTISNKETVLPTAGKETGEPTPPTFHRTRRATGAVGAWPEPGGERFSRSRPGRGRREHRNPGEPRYPADTERFDLEAPGRESVAICWPSCSSRRWSGSDAPTHPLGARTASISTADTGKEPVAVGIAPVPVFTSSLAGHSVPRSTGSRRLTSSASRQARGGILNRRETRFARLPGFKSARCSSSSLPLGQKSQGRDLNPRTPDYKSGA